MTKNRFEVLIDDEHSVTNNDKEFIRVKRKGGKNKHTTTPGLHAVKDKISDKNNYCHTSTSIPFKNVTLLGESDVRNKSERMRSKINDSYKWFM